MDFGNGLPEDSDMARVQWPEALPPEVSTSCSIARS